MINKMKYVTPEIEITKFETLGKIMATGVPGGEDKDDGNIETTAYIGSDPDSGDFPFPVG